MLSFIFISVIVLSSLAWLFDWDGNRKGKRRFGDYPDNHDCYKDPDFFVDDTSSN